MSKPFITNLCPMGTRTIEPMMMHDNRNGAICTVRSAINNCRNLPCAQQSVQICPMNIPAMRQARARSSLRSRSKSRSKTPTSAASESKRPLVNEPLSWCTVVRSTSAYPHNAQANGDHAVDACEAQYPSVLANNFLTVEKAPSFPTCGCSTAGSASTYRSSGTIVQSSTQDRSVLDVTNNFPQISQGIKHSMDGIVSGLQHELEKVKSQIEQLSIHQNDSVYGKGEPGKQFHQLKIENKQLKRQLEIKRKLYMASAKELERAKDILQDYEAKVTLLHQQAVKSSKVMKQSKEKFCKCLKDKENTIKLLRKNNEEFKSVIKEKEMHCCEMSTTIKSLQGLEKQLEAAENEKEEYRNEAEAVKLQLKAKRCETCSKIEARLKKQKEKYDQKIQKYSESERALKQEIAELNDKIQLISTPSVSLENLRSECNGLQVKLREYELQASKYHDLEDECRQQYELLEEHEKTFDKERQQLKMLVNELTNVVKENKITITQLTDLNKEQEDLLLSQSTVLSRKEEELKSAESEIEMLKSRSAELEKEIDDMRTSLDGPCDKEGCLCLSKELENLRSAFDMEIDNKLLKEKIIEDQSHTINMLQRQIEDKVEELSKAKEESSIAEEEIVKINDDLMRKHIELEKEIDEKGRLLQKLRRLEIQKSALSNEMIELESLLERHCQCQKYDKDQHQAIVEFKKQVASQRREWECQKVHLAEEKEKAVKAAKFATQKLIDTVADFQKQVVAQRKVQVMLTKMLHDKEEELQIVKEKISSINTIVKTPSNGDFTVDELFIRNLSDPGTGSSFYSSSSNCVDSCRCGPMPQKNSKVSRKELQEVFEKITRTEEPIRDFKY